MTTEGTDFEPGVINTSPEDERLEDIFTTQADRVDRRLETMRLKAGQVQTRTMARIHRDIDALDLQRDAIRDDLLEMREADGTAWEALRTKVEQGLGELEEGIEALWTELKGSDPKEG